MKRLIGLIYILVLVQGCTTLSPVSYESNASVTSNKTVVINFKTGQIDGRPGKLDVATGSGAVVGVSMPEFYHLKFNEEDQSAFIDSLISELNRLKIVKAIESGDALGNKDDASIEIFFRQTHHDPRDHSYILDVGMTINDVDDVTKKNYKVVSSEGESWLSKTNNWAGQGKTKAGQMLLNKVIPDIEGWVKRNKFKR